MASNSLAKFGASVKKTFSKVIGSSKVDVRMHNDRAEHGAGYNKYDKHIFGDQLRDSLRLLQYYRQLNSNDRVACSLRKSALQTLYKIYSFKLRPNDLSEEPCFETLLQKELLKLINQPYGVQGDGVNPGGVSRMVGPNSPLWELSNWSLKLTRVLIESGLLSDVLSKSVEDHLANLIETIHDYRLKGRICPGSSESTALLADCLYKLFRENRHSDNHQRKLASIDFVRGHLFPLACDFAAKEYPASLVDPIIHYVVFDRMEEPGEVDKVLVEWHTRNGRQGVLRGGSKRYRPRNQIGCNGAESNEFEAQLLPPTHVCLEYLIFELTLTSALGNTLGYFLQQKILEQNATNNSSVDRYEPGKSSIMSRIVALSILGRVRLLTAGPLKSSFLDLFVLPSFQQDCLLMKICKFQLMRQKRFPDIETGLKVAQVFFEEFMKIVDIEDLQDKRNRLFQIFACVASDCLYLVRDGFTISRRLGALFIAHLAPLKRESQLNLVKKVIALYRDYNVFEPLFMIEIVLHRNKTDDLFTSKCERYLAEVIDLITAELLAPSQKEYGDRAELLRLLLHSAASIKRQPLPYKTADNLLNVAYIIGRNSCILSDSDQISSQIWSWAYLKCVFKFPPSEQTQATALEMLDQLLERLLKNLKYSDSACGLATMILGNLAFYQAISSSSPSSNYRAITQSGRRDKRNQLFESPSRIHRILVLCDIMPPKIASTLLRLTFSSSCIMSILMSWPSSSAAEGLEPTKASEELDRTWKAFVRSAQTRLDRIEAKEIDDFNQHRKVLLGSVDDTSRRIPGTVCETRTNLLFALIAALNEKPSQLQSFLDVTKGRPSKGGSHVLRYVKLWLDDAIWSKELNEDTFTAKSYVHISYQALINIHRACASGKLVFSIKELSNQLNSARRVVLEWLSKRATLRDSPIKNFYADSFRRLEAIGNYR